MTEIPTFKVVLLGDSGVGKTCIRSQFVHHIFTNAYKATIGGDYLTTTIEVDKVSSSESINSHIDDLDRRSLSTKEKTKVNLQIWDTAGQERFNSISQAFYRGTDIVVLVYDITNYESVLSLRNWFKRFMENCGVSHPGVIIIGNKIDRINDRCVDLEEIREVITNNTDVSVGVYVLDWETDCMEVCSKNLDQVNKAFKRVAELGLELMNNDSKRKIIGFDSIDLSEGINNKNNCFC
ncbi:ypt/Rab-type GTPase Ypt7p [[Candida] jaroonii]|uniref:Ypt/Rab-type GTPase Ypt7p n=1 Tax=[Candida] jaroonii TaxID=467808 RepID=A0ACA9Y193_9ASCO|nr:ypt/Rab-type GTPase Ypt7p [[Candida] jaroonii]